nr:hypothetical protein [Tanacetum cinerariifolium]
MPGNDTDADDADVRPIYDKEPMAETDCHLKAGGRSSIRSRKLPKEAQPYQADTFGSNIMNKTAYTAYSDPKGVIYKDQNNINRLGWNICQKEIEWIRQTKGSVYDLGYQKATPSKEANAESGKVSWWKRIRE